MIYKPNQFVRQALVFAFVLGLLVVAGYQHAKPIGLSAIELSNSSRTKDSVDKTVYLGYAYAPINDSIKINPDTSHISQTQFLKFKRQSSTGRVIYDKSKITVKTNRFTITTSKATLNFSTDSVLKADHKDYRYQTYRGFFKPLKLYFYENTAVLYGEGFELSQLNMIDSLTNVQYELGSNCDFSSQIPIFSPHQKFMAFYSNAEEGDQPESLLNVIKINKGDKGNSFVDYSALKSGNWLITDMVWIDDKSLAINAARIPRYSKKDKKHTYLKFTIN